MVFFTSSRVFLLDFNPLEGLAEVVSAGVSPLGISIISILIP